MIIAAEPVAELRGVHSSLRIWRVAPRVVLVVIRGHDVGEHGDTPLHFLESELNEGAAQLFIDARESKGASMDVSNAWSRWLRGHRDVLNEIHMLTESPFIRVTADFVRRFADLGDIMFLY